MTTSSSTSNTAQSGAAPASVNEALIASFSALDTADELQTTRAALHATQDEHSSAQRVLFDEVARLTRDVHDAIRTIAAESGLTNAPRSSARDSLEYVVTLTERSAHRTLDSVECALPIVETIAREVRAASERAQGADTLPGHGQLALQLEHSALQAEQLQALLSDILMAQDFQDLTGQIVRRVANLLRDVEDKLFGLLKVAANLQAMSGSVAALEIVATLRSGIEAEGPVIPGSDRKDVARDQDEVDELLSKLGF